MYSYSTSLQSAIHDGPYNYFNNWNYASFATSLCSTFHAVYDNAYFGHDLTETCTNPSIFAVQIKTNAELKMALSRAEREPQKLAFLECCIDPSDISSTLHRFGYIIGARSKTGK